jgi:hypothetical protein
MQKRLNEAVRRKRPDLWPNDWILHYDKAPAHKAFSVKQFVPQKSMAEMEHHPFPLIWLRMTWDCLSALKGRRFQDTEEIQGKCDENECNSTTRVPKMFSTVVASLS